MGRRSPTGTLSKVERIEDIAHKAPGNNSARFSDSAYRLYPQIVSARLRPSGYARMGVIARSSLHPFGAFSVDVSDSNRWNNCKSASALEY